MDDGEAKSNVLVAPESVRGIVTRCTELASPRDPAHNFSTSGSCRTWSNGKSGFCCWLGEMCTNRVVGCAGGQHCCRSRANCGRRRRRGAMTGSHAPATAVFCHMRSWRCKVPMDGGEPQTAESEEVGSDSPGLVAAEALNRSISKLASMD